MRTSCELTLDTGVGYGRLRQHCVKSRLDALHMGLTMPFTTRIIVLTLGKMLHTLQARAEGYDATASSPGVNPLNLPQGYGWKV